MLILLIISIAMVIAGFLISELTYSDCELLSIIGVVAIIVIAIAWPVNYYSVKSDISQYHATKYTIEEARKIDSLERAALTQKIIETNSWLANVKYWNDTIFGQAIPDEIESLEFLK